MDVKMRRFLSSIGINSDDGFDLRFVLIAKNPYKMGQIDMAIEKDSPWSYEALDKFFDGLRNIQYPYSLRLSYSHDISNQDVIQLFDDWCLFNSRTGLPKLVEENDSLIFHYADVNAKAMAAPSIKEFRQFLSFINYSASIFEIIDPIPEKEGVYVEVIKEKTLQEKVEAVASAINIPSTEEKKEENPKEEDDAPLTSDQRDIEDVLNMDSPYLDFDEIKRGLGFAPQSVAPQETMEDVVGETKTEEVVASVLEEPVETPKEEPDIGAPTSIVMESESEEEDDDTRDEEPDLVEDEDRASGESQREYGEEFLIERRIQAHQWQKEQENRERVWSRGNYQIIRHIGDLYKIKMTDNIEFEGEIFQVRYSVNRSGKSMNVFAVGDETNAITIRAFEGKSITMEMLKKLNPKMRCKIRGALDNDKYTRARIVVAHYIDLLPPKPLRTDPEENKRVELHLHTIMSTMDAVAAFSDYYATARNMGMTAIGLCDHGSVQSFPAAQYARDAHVEYIKDHPDCGETPLKIIYGCEFYMFDQSLHPVMNPSPVKLEHAKYCVFDTETTGLSVRYDRLLEFGGCIYQDGVKIKEWGTLINPEMDLSEAASALVINKIKEEELLSAPTLDEILPQILEFLDGCILVAHNAPFDVGFLNRILKERGLPPLTNPVIDTVYLSRYFFPKASAHNEGALLKNLGLRNYEAESAHRAVYDASALAEGWNELLKMLLAGNHDILHDDLASLSVQNPDNLDGIDKNSPEYQEDMESYLKYCRGFHQHHITAYAKNKQGIADLFELISISETKYFYRVPRTPRELIAEKRDNLLLGSACFNGEIFDIAQTRDIDDLVKAMAFYDFIEIQPLENYSFLIDMNRVPSWNRLKAMLNDIIHAAKIAGKTIVATGDAHYVNPEDKIYRDIFIASKGIGNTRHDLFPYTRDGMEPFENPDQHFRSTREMLDSFEEWLPQEQAYEYVVTNSNYIADQVEDDIVIVSSKTFTPNANLPDSEEKIRTLCESNFHKNYDYLYGDNDPEVLEAIEKAHSRMERELTGIIGSGYAVTYYIAHRLIQLANAEPEHFIVGSRGSVGSSFAATMAEITEVNPLPAHYHCPHCHYLRFMDATVYRSGFDLPDADCPKCGHKLETNGQNIPFETFLGFHADKVPDIDLNFEDESQHRAHNYCKDLLGYDNVYRAGTIETVAEKTAFGYVRGYFESIGQDPDAINNQYIAYLASHCQGVKRTTGQHPGGIVVIPSDHSVYEFTPVQYPADDLKAEWRTTHFDFHALHDEILKLDILGHVDPMAMRYYRDLTGIDIESIPLNDPKVLSLFSSTEQLGMHRNYLGVDNGATALPEFGTQLGMQMLSAIKPKCFNDLIIIAGLAHGTGVWAGNAEELVRQGKNINEIIGCRDEIMTYLISKGVPSSDAFKIMEKVRKGKGLTSSQEALMRANGVPDFYIESCKKIEYLFPRGHATAYVTMAVRVAYFKLYYPLEFYAVFFSVRSDDWDIQTMIEGEEAVIAKIEDFKQRSNDRLNAPSNKEKNQNKTLLVALEMLERGYTFANINLYKSDSKMFICDHENKCLIPPFVVVDGLGENVAKSIVEARQQVDMDGKVMEFISKRDLQERTRLSGTLVKKLDELGVLRGLSETNQPSLFDFD